MADPRIAELAISLPFNINEFGSVAFTTSQEKIWADRVRAAVGTGVNERVMRPSYGADVRGAVMSTAEEAQETIKREIEIAFSRDLSLLKLTAVNTSYDATTSSVNVEVIYQLPNREIDSVLLGFAILSGSAPLIEDTL